MSSKCKQTGKRMSGGIRNYGIKSVRVWQMTVKSIRIKDATYAYKMDGVGEPLVLLHGFTGTKSTWDPFFDMLSSHFTVIAIDMPGHGDTVSDSPRTMEMFSEDLKCFLRAFNIDKAALLGYSMGGRAALSFASTYPEHVSKLMLESASPGLKTEQERKERREADRKLAEMIVDKGVLTFIDFWENIPLFHTQKRLPEEAKKNIRTEREKQTSGGLSASLLHMGTGIQPSWWENLKQLDIPVSLIAGSEDEKFVRINKEMNKKLPHSELNVVKDAGHAVHVEQAGKFVKIVREFMEGKKIT